ncbi:MAG: Ig-like domain-containing protein [Gemmatimonadales bacterium]
MQPPPGGPEDRAPPEIVATSPDTLAAIPGFDGEVSFQFNEVISEGGSPNFGLGTGDLEKLVILSPTSAVPQVRWRRTRITARPREDWQPNRAYRVELLPGVADLSGNRSEGRAVVTFTTGGPLPDWTLRGRVVSWANQRPVAVNGLVEAVLLPDSLAYRTMADSAGWFALGPIPRGEYLVFGAIDQNRDLRWDPREDFDSVRVAAGRDSVGEIWAFRHDTIPARIAGTQVRDSLSIGITFSQSLNPYQRLPTDSVRVLLLPDSVPLPVERILPPAEFDTLFRPQPVIDTTPGGRARADSIRADSIARARADSIRADSIARARRAAEIRIPGAERQQPVGADTAGRAPLRTKPALFDRLVIRLGEPLIPGRTYAVVVQGVENVSRVAGVALGGFTVPERARPDTTAARPPPDSGRVRRPPG